MFGVQNTSLSRKPFPVDNTLSGWKTFFSIEKSVFGRKYSVRSKIHCTLSFKKYCLVDCLVSHSVSGENTVSCWKNNLSGWKNTVSGGKILFPVEKILFSVEKQNFSGWKNTVSGRKNIASGWKNTVFRKCRGGYSRPNNAHSLIAAEQRAELTKASALTPFIMAATVWHP